MSVILADVCVACSKEFNPSPRCPIVEATVHQQQTGLMLAPLPLAGRGAAGSCRLRPRSCRHLAAWLWPRRPHWTAPERAAAVAAVYTPALWQPQSCRRTRLCPQLEPVVQHKLTCCTGLSCHLLAFQACLQVLQSLPQKAATPTTPNDQMIRHKDRWLFASSDARASKMCAMWAGAVPDQGLSGVTCLDRRLPQRFCWVARADEGPLRPQLHDTPEEIKHPQLSLKTPCTTLSYKQQF